MSDGNFSLDRDSDTGLYTMTRSKWACLCCCFTFSSNLTVILFIIASHPSAILQPIFSLP
ncbi:MAG: hypothetical protein EZS28_039452, partial [Streblomastix strix]